MDHGSYNWQSCDYVPWNLNKENHRSIAQKRYSAWYLTCYSQTNRIYKRRFDEIEKLSKYPHITPLRGVIFFARLFQKRQVSTGIKLTKVSGCMSELVDRWDRSLIRSFPPLPPPPLLEGEGIKSFWSFWKCGYNRGVLLIFSGYDRYTRYRNTSESF